MATSAEKTRSDEDKHESARTRTKRGRWLLPALLLIIWVVIGGVGADYQARLGEVLENSNEAFLPASAEATRVAEMKKAFETEAISPALLTFNRDGGLTEADLTYLNDKQAEIAGLKHPDLDPLGGLAERTLPVIPSEDGEAAQIIVALDAALGDKEAGVAKELRRIAGEGIPAGLEVNLTGPAGIGVDLEGVFGAIDGMLLLVTVGAVIVILLLIYRSPLMPLIVLTSSGLALTTASAVVYLLARDGVLTLDSQGQGILMVLVFGAATDYALLVVARFREELHLTANRFDAVRKSVRACVAPLFASAGTVALGLLCLLLSDLNNNRSLGPVGAIGVAASLAVTLTFLPALLALFGRASFWPFRPKHDGQPQRHGLFAKVSALVSRKPRTVWAGTLVLLLAAAAFAPQFRASGLDYVDTFTKDTESVRGLEVSAEHFPGGANLPGTIIARTEQRDEVIAAAQAVDGVARVTPTVDLETGQPKEADGLSSIDVTLRDISTSRAAQDTIVRLRDAVHAVPGADALVGGDSAALLDTRTTAEQDRWVIIPALLIVILLMLILLLRSLLAPILLTLTVAVSYAATIGVAALVFNELFEFANTDPSLPVLAFVFIAALGTDYNIFLMHRIREEAAKEGTREGTRRGLTLVGGVIVSAGVVLAATFGALAVLPLVGLVQMAFLVSFGVLLDTLIVRSLLVPALTIHIGRKFWWPSKLAKLDS
ncbi:RND superfamily putative drug exporter [Saccharothrix saharensis]|uniref:RND superfamily putative drug exporter n=1 Tax=Saccharothrix saharensis TaxID=571190 RepID=A0A543J4Z9_9PSEU|nr:MMPL family transporter [Saccharothrix saharensis]TQM77828.1 RND superfamily putative drug exporter [Saccharothrix saharensis]